MKKKCVICLIVCVIIVLLSIGIYNYKNKYYDLSQITNVDLNKLYTRGRSSYYNEVLNYFYGDKYKASSLDTGSTANMLLIFYDENGNEQLKLDFLGNRNQVCVNEEKYLYKTYNEFKYTTKELYPDKNKGECEKMLYDIIMLYNMDNQYMWEYYNDKNSDYPENYNKGMTFSNEGINVDVLEYKDNSIEKDYLKECNRIISVYGGNLDSNFKIDKREVNNYIGANEKYKYTVIKYDNFIISICYSYDYRYQDFVEVNKNIEILNKHLRNLGIL